MAKPYDRNCIWCNRRITMVPTWYGKWDAYEGKRMHNCPMRPRGKSKGQGSVAWRPRLTLGKTLRDIGAACAIGLFLLIVWLFVR
jgi:hypothetical protein